jgi:hypothetical protein
MNNYRIVFDVVANGTVVGYVLEPIGDNALYGVTPSDISAYLIEGDTIENCSYGVDDGILYITGSGNFIDIYSIDEQLMLVGSSDSFTALASIPAA